MRSNTGVMVGPARSDMMTTIAVWSSGRLACAACTRASAARDAAVRIAAGLSQAGVQLRERGVVLLDAVEQVVERRDVSTPAVGDLARRCAR